VKLYRGGKLMTVNAKIGELDLNAENATPAGQLVMAGPPAKMPDGQKSAVGLYLADLDASVAKQINMPADKHGALITDVAPQSDAAPPQSQIVFFQPGEVVLEIDDKPVANAKEAAAAFAVVPAGHTALVVIWRQGEPQLVLLKKH